MVGEASGREPAPPSAGAGRRGGGYRIRAPDGGYIHRRMRCIGTDLSGALPYLFDPFPAGSPKLANRPRPRWVHDDHIDTAEQALHAAQRQDPPAHPDRWATKGDFDELFSDEIEAKLVPEAEDVGGLANVVAGVIGLAVAVAFFRHRDCVGVVARYLR